MDHSREPGTVTGCHGTTGSTSAVSCWKLWRGQDSAHLVLLLRMIALWKLEGFTNEEIAKRIGFAQRTVANRLELIRKIWELEARKSA